jgi:hypothetical protein
VTTPRRSGAEDPTGEHAAETPWSVTDVSPQLRRELDRFGVTQKIGADHVFDSLESARAAFHAARNNKTEGER